MANHILGYSSAHHVSLPSYEPQLSKDTYNAYEKEKKNIYI